MGGPTFCYEIGYAGYAKFREKDILATDGNFQITHNQIFTNGVYGAGFLNASPHMAVAHDYPVITANIGFQLTDGEIYYELGKSITTLRDSQHKVEIYPNGYGGYSSKAYIQSLQLSASQDSLVTGSISLKGSQISSIVAGSPSTNSAKSTGNKRLSSSVSTYLGVFPSYGTKWSFGNDNFSDQVLSWGISTSQTVQFLKICNCSTNKLNSLVADYAVIGIVQVNGNGQLIGVQKCFNKESGFEFQSDSSTLTLYSNTGKEKKIKFNNMQCTNISSSLQTGNNLIATSFQFVAIGSSSTSAKIIDFDPEKNEGES